jgi:hypothetical protein
MKTFSEWQQDEQLPSLTLVKSLLLKMAAAAQETYDDWDQDEDGMNDELGAGGICQDVADAIGDVLNSAGIDVKVLDGNGIGEQHVWLAVKLKEGVFEVDIPPGVYETGGGYSWKKIPGVKFKPSDIVIEKSHMTDEEFEEES